MAESKKSGTETKKSSPSESTGEGKNMDTKRIGKYIFWVGIVLALVFAIWAESPDWIPPLLIVLGLLGGYMRISKVSEVHFIVLSIGLAFFGNVLAEFSTFGTFLTDLIGGLIFFLGGAVLALVVRNIISWFR